MTREQAKELVPIIKAFGDGKQVEFKSFDGWKVLNDYPSFMSEPEYYRIKLEPKKRLMTRGEILYMVTTTPAMVVREGDSAVFPAMRLSYLDDISLYEWAIIDKHGDPIDGWHKFETEDNDE
jgi:hypothetical protein